MFSKNNGITNKQNEKQNTTKQKNSRLQDLRQTTVSVREKTNEQLTTWSHAFDFPRLATITCTFLRIFIVAELLSRTLATHLLTKALVFCLQKIDLKFYLLN